MGLRVVVVLECVICHAQYPEPEGKVLGEDYVVESSPTCDQERELPVPGRTKWNGEPVTRLQPCGGKALAKIKFEEVADA